MINNSWGWNYSIKETAQVITLPDSEAIYFCFSLRKRQITSQGLESKPAAYFIIIPSDTCYLKTRNIGKVLNDFLKRR